MRREKLSEMAQNGDYMRKCKKVREMAAMTTRAMEATSSAASSFKRRKKASNFDDQLVTDHLHGMNSPENSASPPATTIEFGNYRSRSVNLNEEVELEVEPHDEGTLISCCCCRFRKTTPLSKPCAETKSSTTKKPSAATLCRKHPAAKMPSAAEIEKFFATAEKYEQKLFAEKYNYDIVKDVPLEGRYQWVRLKP